MISIPTLFAIHIYILVLLFKRNLFSFFMNYFFFLQLFRSRRKGSRNQKPKSDKITTNYWILLKIKINYNKFFSFSSSQWLSWKAEENLWILPSQLIPLSSYTILVLHVGWTLRFPDIWDVSITFKSCWLDVIADYIMWKTSYNFWKDAARRRHV